MKLRRIVTVYTLAFGVPLLLLGGGTSPAAVRTAASPRVQTLQAAALPAKIADPVTVTLDTPTHRVVKRVQVGHYDIPATALLAYQTAAKILTAAKPSCHLSWPLLAAIGRVESDHGRFGGATLAPTGFSSPRVVGVALDGKGPVAAIPDTDQGRWDGDTTWDHAVGPMQFLPSTWRLVGVDADGDGLRSIDDINDAALGAGVYLCAGASQSLASSTGMQQAVYRYNPSAQYVALVMAYETLYSGGDFQVVNPNVGGSTAVLTGPSLSGVPLTVGGAVKATVKTAVRDAIDSTQRHHGTTIQRSAGARTPADKTTTVKVSPANATDKSIGKSAGKGSGGGSNTPTPSPSPTGSSTGGSSSGGGGAGGSGTDSGSGGGSGGTSPPADQGGSGGGTTTDQSGGGTATPSPTPDSQGSPTPTPTPQPDPTPTPSTVTGVVTEQGGTYALDGKPLELGTLADSAATARGDFDGDGAVETNGAELAGLVGKTVTMVVVERTSGSLGIYSINGISLA